MPEKNRGRKRLVILVLIMVVISFLGSSTSLYLTYQAAIQQQKDRLFDIVLSQKELIEAVARFDEVYSNDAHPLGSTAATLGQYFDGYKNFQFHAETGELVLGQILRGQIHILLRQNKHHSKSKKLSKKNIPLNGKRAEPMRLALQNRQGNIISQDYDGNKVIAAYSTMKISGRQFGIVAKIDLAEVQTPYLNAVLASFGVTFFLILLGSFGFLRQINPVIQELKEGYELLERRVQERTAELQIAKEKAVEAAKTKGLFLANMSHELRTPMNSVLGFLKLAIEDPALPKNLIKYLTTAHSSAASLLVVLNDILDISKLENKKFELEEIKFSLYKLLNEVVHSFHLKVEEKGLEVLLVVEPDLAFCRVGDPSRLRQVCINLIGNAIKFTEKGGVTLSVSTTDHPDVLHFQVSDTGIGIEEEKIHKIFEEFSQADASTTRKFGGTGLGTTISKKLVELMGGKIWVESVFGEGSCFNFTVALPPSPCITKECSSICKEGQNVEDAQASQFTRRLQILVVDDIQANLDLASIRLEQQGHIVKTAMDGIEAIEQFQTGDFDVIFMDIQMPVMDGLEATRRIRKLENNGLNPVTVIALTASVLPEEVNICYEAGLDSFVKKPINFEEMFAALRKTVPAGRGIPIVANGILPFDSHEASLVPQTVAGINLAKGILTWHDEQKYTKAILGFVADTKKTIPEIQALVERKDYSKLAKLGHSLKGVAGNLAMQELSMAAANLDLAARQHDMEGVKASVEEITKQFKVVEGSSTRLNSEIVNSEKVQYNKEAVVLGLKELIIALGEDEPSAGEAICEHLSQYLHRVQLQQVLSQLESFDFIAAADAVYQLADTLKIKIKD